MHRICREPPSCARRIRPGALAIALAALSSVLVLGCADPKPAGQGSFTFLAQSEVISFREGDAFSTSSNLAVATNGRVYVLCETDQGVRSVQAFTSDLVADGSLTIAAGFEPYALWVDGTELHVWCKAESPSTVWTDYVYYAETGVATGDSYEAKALCDPFQSWAMLGVDAGSDRIYYADMLMKAVGIASIQSGAWVQTAKIDEARLRSYLPRRDRELAFDICDVSWNGSDRIALGLRLIDSKEGGGVIVLDAASLELVDYLGGGWALEGIYGLDYDAAGRLVCADDWGESLRVVSGRELLDWSCDGETEGGFESGYIEEPTRLRVLGDAVFVLDADSHRILKYRYEP